MEHSPFGCPQKFGQGHHDIRSARAAFPNGVYQPAGSFRFSVDALLLASFIKNSPGRIMADLGAGCGIVGLAYLLMHPEAVGVGAEVQPELVAAANGNAARLGCASRYRCLETDVTSPDFAKHLFSSFGQRKNTGVKQQLVVKNSAADAGFDLVLANPPYRILGTGRLPKSPMRQKALFAPRGTVKQFCTAAFSVLKAQGVLGMVFPAEQMTWLCAVLRETGFGVRRVLPVHGREGKPPTLILVEGYKVAFPPRPASESALALDAFPLNGQFPDMPLSSDGPLCPDVPLCFNVPLCSGVSCLEANDKLLGGNCLNANPLDGRFLDDNFPGGKVPESKFSKGKFLKGKFPDAMLLAEGFHGASPGPSQGRVNTGSALFKSTSQSPQAVSLNEMSPKGMRQLGVALKGVGPESMNPEDRLVVEDGRGTQNRLPGEEKTIFETPLVLYDKDNRLSGQALEFCPYLA